MLGHPSARELMMIVAAVGLAQNFGAVRSLVTTGIQHGHMKMDLTNILNHLGATAPQAESAQQYFCDKTVSFSAVRDFFEGDEKVHPEQLPFFIPHSSSLKNRWPPPMFRRFRRRRCGADFRLR